MKYGIWLFTGKYGGYGWLSTIGDWIKQFYTIVSLTVAATMIYTTH